ncbi:hypothetical protein [Fodinicola acaciae]|uniref:hypothetical protein n=1 Tax=Fodinicola acaciae TaxID=2681555 RepID=UPI0013D53295|nr:hypothetical protein [Fodinicola acaciae]
MTDERVEESKAEEGRYDGRYGAAEPAGDPDNDNVHVPGMLENFQTVFGRHRAQGQSDADGS